MESKSIKKFKDILIKSIPFSPNNEQTKKELLGQSISSVMLHYIHWAYRLVPQRSRKIIIEPYVTADHRWHHLKNKIHPFLSKAIAGEDLTPYLSLQVRRKGYVPAIKIENSSVGRWEDKDLILNTMGFHHFHLGEKINFKDIAERTDDVLLAKVSRDIFHCIGIFNHSVFESPEDESHAMNGERERLWRIFDEITGC
jgi:hypothetical protein